MTEDSKVSMPTPLPTTPATPEQPSPGSPVAVSPASPPPSYSQSIPTPPTASQTANQTPIPILKLARTDKNSDRWMVCKDLKPPSVIPDTLAHYCDPQVYHC